MLQSKPLTAKRAKLASTKIPEKLVKSLDLEIMGRLTSLMARMPVPILRRLESCLESLKSIIARVTVRAVNREVAIPIIRVRPKPLTEPVPNLYKIAAVKKVVRLESKIALKAFS